MGRRRERGRTSARPPAPVHEAATAGALRAWRPETVAVLGGLALVLFLMRLVSNAVGWWGMLRYPAELNIGEGVTLFEAKRLAAGQPIYKPVDEPPYWFATYPPLYQWFVSLWVDAGLAWGRALSLGASAANGILAGLAVWRLGGGRLASALAVLIWLTSPYTDYWTAAARVDMLGRALASASVCCVIGRTGRWPWLWAGVVLASLAMMTKQTMVAGGLACVLILLLESRLRATVFGAAWLSLTLAGYGALTLATGGHFWRNVFGDIARSTQWSLMMQFVGGFVQVHAPLLLASAVAIAGGWRQPGVRRATCVALAGVPHLLLTGNDGADVNYFFDVVWGLAVLSTAGMGAAHGAPRWQGPLAGVFVLAGALMSVALLEPLRGPTPEQEAAARRITEILRRAGPPVQSEFVGYTLAAGGEPDYLPYMYRLLEERGVWNSAPIVGRIERREYHAILVTSRAPARWGRSILDALERYYEPAEVFRGTYIIEGPDDQILYRPRR
ncbi:MAG: glycosyltransferase family 39 protein [Candidatus Sumerlaeaceae bacterium]|nr:glycosyltransferase family 39 protein [Candidatus Sumerlaeaceae bacterium]